MKKRGIAKCHSCRKLHPIGTKNTMLQRLEYDQYTIVVPKSQEFREMSSLSDRYLGTHVARFIRDIGKKRGNM